MRCDFCHNSEFVLPKKIQNLKRDMHAEKEFFEFLTQRVWLLDGVSICGGEPTIHHNLPRFFRQIHDLGFDIKLDTNGQNPDMLEYLIQHKLVDYIAMDIKHTWEKYSSIVWVQEDITPYKKSVDIIRSGACDYEFRTTLIWGIHTPADIAGMGEIIRGAKHYYLQRYRQKNVLNPDFIGYSPTDAMLSEWRNKLQWTYVDSVQIRF